jgi:thiamine biosynthesis lipoprotein
MSCGATVVVTAETPGGRFARHAVARLHELERTWSRFVPTSEISGLNRAAGAPRRVGVDTVRLVEALVQAWHATAGAFDPTLLGTLVELGYAASRDDATTHTSLSSDVGRRGRPDEIVLDPTAGIVRLPPGTTLDAGGLGKGLAADIVTAELLAAGAAGALVEVGGDVRVAGAAPDSNGWAISVTPAMSGERARVVGLLDGGIATSTSRLRTWRRAGRDHHHLIDPVTLRPADHGTVSCTVIAGSAAWAEAFAKVAFVTDLPDAVERLDARGLAASITTTDGAHHVTTAWKEFAR